VLFVGLALRGAVRRAPYMWCRMSCLWCSSS